MADWTDGYITNIDYASGDGAALSASGANEPRGAKREPGRRIA